MDAPAPHELDSARELGDVDSSDRDGRLCSVRRWHASTALKMDQDCLDEMLERWKTVPDSDDTAAIAELDADFEALSLAAQDQLLDGIDAWRLEGERIIAERQAQAAREQELLESAVRARPCWSDTDGAEQAPRRLRRLERAP